MKSRQNVSQFYVIAIQRLIFHPRSNSQFEMLLIVTYYVS